MLSKKEILQKKIEELKNISGLDININIEQDDIDSSINKLSSLLHSLSNQKNKHIILKQIILSNIQEKDLYLYDNILNFDDNYKYCLFCLYFQNSTDDILQDLLKEFFPKKEDYIININSKLICILHRHKNKDILSFSNKIVDFINTEAMLNVKLIYSQDFKDISKLHEIYKSNILCLDIAKIFNNEQAVFSAQKLGINGLLYEIPKYALERFLNEYLSSYKDFEISNENLHTINVFINNNLNISETARILHMHRNTLVYRIEQLEAKTGLNLRSFEGAMIFKLINLITIYLKTKKE